MRDLTDFECEMVGGSGWWEDFSESWNQFWHDRGQNLSDFFAGISNSRRADMQACLSAGGTYTGSSQGVNFSVSPNGTITTGVENTNWGCSSPPPPPPPPPSPPTIVILRGTSYKQQQ